MTDPSQDQTARNRFLVIAMVRLFGVAMILMAIAIAQGMVDLPPITVWVLAPLGVIEAFLMPVVLARMWRSADQMPPRR